MVLLTVGIVFPLSLLRGMRALEYVSSGGVVLLIALMAVIGYDAVASGFHGITSGEVPLWTLDLSNPRLPESFALIGFRYVVTVP